MSCETYREALIEAAALGVAPQGELRTHLGGCGSCRAAFTLEQSLFASIDSGLHTAANVDVPPSFLPQVRALLNHQAAPRRFWLPAWSMIAAAALVLVVVLIHNLEHSSPGAVPKESVVANNASVPDRSSVPTFQPVERAAQTTRDKRIRPAQISRVAPFEQVPVLVPAGQKQVIDALLSALQQGKTKPDVLLAEKSQLPFEDLQVSPLDISPIEMKPLLDVSGDSPTGTEKTRL